MTGKGIDLCISHGWNEDGELFEVEVLYLKSGEDPNPHDNTLQQSKIAIGKQTLLKIAFILHMVIVRS